MKRPTIADAMAAERPLVTPLAHDALSARFIARAGFRAFAIGGSALLASRLGLPDIGLVGLADMAEGIRDIAAATPLPFFADGDDGYGDVKSVARMVRTYEDIGVGAILIEDQQREHKQQRADRALGIADRGVIEAKLRVALAERSNPQTFIIGRTDAAVFAGLDEALLRAERFLALGVDGVFVAGLRAMEDYERVGRELRGARLSAALFETPGMPAHARGARRAGLCARVVSRDADVPRRRGDAGSARRAAASRRRRRAHDADPNANAARAVLDDALDLARWQAIEKGHSRGSGNPATSTTNGGGA